jgi:hypothetical protein
VFRRKELKVTGFVGDNIPINLRVAQRKYARFVFHFERAPSFRPSSMFKVLSDTHPFKVDCTEFPTFISSPIPDFVHVVNYSNTSNNSNGNNTGTPSNVATFQLGLWVPILLILSVIGAVYAIYAMDVGKGISLIVLIAQSLLDSLIFRQTIKQVKLH